MRNYLDSPSEVLEFKRLVESMRRKGCAIAIFNPTELQGVDPKRVQDHMVAAGNAAIETLKETK